MSEWPVVRFEELAAPEKSSFSKPYGSAYTKNDYVPSGVPLVRGVNLGNGRFRDDDFVFITKEKADSLPGANLTSGDLVITHRGTIGQVSMIPRSPKYDRYVLSTSQVKARLNSAQAIPEFYYYWLTSPAGQREILQHVSTVGVPGLVQPVATVKSFKVPHPPVVEQRAVVALLGGLDDKIVVNERIAATADELAYEQFKQALRHLNGMTTPLGSLATVVLGGTPSRANPSYWADGTVNWVNSGKANDFRVMQPSALITQEALENSAAKIMPCGATVVAITGATMGQVSRLEIETSGNQSLVGVWSRERPLNDWLFFWIRHHRNELIKHGTGGAQQHINKSVVTSLEVRTPDLPLLQEWSSQTTPLLAMGAQALRENLTLATLRDTLLPQLMSGRLRVKDAETIVEDHT
ncbi:restriction endonuclease subunit S [Streptomyces sp. NPDC001070]